MQIHLNNYTVDVTVNQRTNIDYKRHVEIRVEGPEYQHIYLSLEDAKRLLNVLKIALDIALDIASITNNEALK
jgi:hypothetical protein